MKKFIGCLVALFVLGASSAGFAKPEKGWHKGSYFLVSLGFMNNDEDTNVTTNTSFGNTNIMGYGLTLGWNFLDFLAAELQTRYGTDATGGNREHAANIDFLLKYSLILDALTRSETVRFLPYAKAGAGVYGAAVPTANAVTNRFGVYGPAGVFSLGMEALLGKIFYVGADVTNHFVNLQAKNNSAGTRILNGGFDYQYSVFGYFGVHF